MAKLYNFCTYNGIKGGKFQSSSWDVCCDQWIERPEGNPADWDCAIDPDTTWSCFGPNPQNWECRSDPSADWAQGGITAQQWECPIDALTDWAEGGIKPQDWVCDTIPDETWVGAGVNPVEYEKDAPAGAWEEAEPPDPAVYDPILKDDRAGLDCGD